MRSKPWSTIGKKTTVFCFDRFFFFFFLPQSIRKVQYHLGHYLKGGKICFLILVLAEDFTTSVKKKKKKSKQRLSISCVTCCSGIIFVPAWAISPLYWLYAQKVGPALQFEIHYVMRAWLHFRAAIDIQLVGKERSCETEKRMIEGCCRTAPESSYLQSFLKFIGRHKPESPVWVIIFECLLLKLWWLLISSQNTIQNYPCLFDSGGISTQIQDSNVKVAYSITSKSKISKSHLKQLQKTFTVLILVVPLSQSKHRGPS